jgi:hypothetical protein
MMANPSLSAWAKVAMGAQAIQAGDSEEAQRRLSGTRSAFERTQDILGLARCLHYTARLEAKLGHTQAALELLGESAALHTEMGVRPWLGRDLHQMGLLAYRSGDAAGGEIKLRQALELLGGLGSGHAEEVRADLARLAGSS